MIDAARVVIYCGYPLEKWNHVSRDEMYCMARDRMCQLTSVFHKTFSVGCPLKLHTRRLVKDFRSCCTPWIATSFDPVALRLLFLHQR